MNSPNRRVLGEKSTNASINTQEHGQNTKGSMQLLSATTRTQHASPRRAGTKRRYHDIDSGSFEEADEKHESARARSGPRARPVIEETDEEADSFLSSVVESHSTETSSSSLQTSTTSVLTSFYPSQEPSQPMEEQFEIIQEESQRTLEQIHATPMPEHKFLLLPPDKPALRTEGSQDSVRMSSFIDFDEIDESQQEKVNEVKVITPPRPAQPKEESPKASQLLEKVTMLRTRLQLAMHKVETNQTSKPFSRLDKPKSVSPELSLSPRLFSATVVPSDCKPQEASARLSPESQIAIHRASAFRGAYLDRGVQRLNSLSVPRIVPTAYSSRYMVPSQTQGTAPQQRTTDIRSSPPPSHGVSANLQIKKTRATPSPSKGLSRRAPLPETPRHQLSSPPGTDDGNTVTTRMRLHEVGRSALTSSVVKGEAANGLLELMRAGSR